MLLRPPLALVIEGLSRLPLASRLIVFGSVARQADAPKDVDVALDVTGMDLLFDRTIQEQYSKTIMGMLQLARRHYGYLDPFVIGNGRMLVRNGEASAYDLARNAKAIRAAIKTEGVPLATVIDRLAPQPEPDETEGDAPRG